MARIETDCDIDLKKKSVKMSVFRKFKFGSKVIEILQKCFL